MVLLLSGLWLTLGCKSTYYSAYETFGVYKRDLLKKRVVAARDAQKDAQQEFKDALTRLKEITGFEGGELEKRYRQLQSDYDAANSRVQAVHKRVEAVETVGKDLFAEWEKENQEIGTSSLRATSRRPGGKPLGSHGASPRVPRCAEFYTLATAWQQIGRH